MIADDPFNLQRFVSAQTRVFEQALGELRLGRKETHWMWYIFPQIQGLGSSSTARLYALSSRAEAAAYLQHPVLGPRLKLCVEAVLQVKGRTLRQILGAPDDIKFRSSMTVFARATPENRLFLDALAKYCAAEFDNATLARL